MSDPLRVLVLEDLDEDAQVLLRELKRGGYSPTWQRVDTASAMTESLNKQPWDIVIADYITPHLSADEALALLQEHEIDIPFIIVSWRDW